MSSIGPNPMRRFNTEGGSDGRSSLVLLRQLSIRYQGVYIIAYRDDEPSEIYFAGYSYD